MALTISTISPQSGPIAGGTLVTITGSGFVPGITEVCIDGGSSGNPGPPGGWTIGAVLMVGDSLAVGAGPYLTFDVPNRTVTVDGRVGRPTTEGVTIIQGIAATLPPVLVVVLGTNDGPNGAVFAPKIEAVMVAAGTSRPVFWVNIWRPGYGELNSTLNAAATHHANLTVIDFTSVILGHPTMIGPDGVHLDGAGYSLMGATIATAIGPGTPRPVDGGHGEANAAVAVAAAIALTGVPASWQLGLMTIAVRESNYDCSVVNNWDSNAQKGTPSKGIMQVIDPTFQAYMLPGHGDIFNCVDNICAAIRYIQARYGDISNVQQAHPELPPHGY